MLRFKKISEFFRFLENLQKAEPLTEEQLMKDIELSEAGDYSVLSTVKGKGALNITIPDMSTIPPSMAYVEAGVATVEGFGTAKIPFERSFSDKPTLLTVPFGFILITVPWVAIEWRYFTIGWWQIRLPVPRLTEMTIRLPAMCFMMSVNEDGFEVFNVAGRTTISYLAIGR